MRTAAALGGIRARWSCPPRATEKNAEEEAGSEAGLSPGLISTLLWVRSSNHNVPWASIRSTPGCHSLGSPPGFSCLHSYAAATSPTWGSWAKPGFLQQDPSYPWFPLLDSLPVAITSHTTAFQGDSLCGHFLTSHSPCSSCQHQGTRMTDIITLCTVSGAESLLSLLLHFLSLSLLLHFLPSPPPSSP